MTLKNSVTQACQRKEVVGNISIKAITLLSLNFMRPVEIFDLIKDKVLKKVNTLQATEASLPRKQKILTKNFFGNKTSVYDAACDVKMCSRCIYFNVFNTVVN